MNAMNIYIFFILISFFFLPHRLYAQTYPLATARQGQWQQKVTAFGRVTALAETTLTIPFAVKITRITIQNGQKIAAGQILFRFQSPAFIKDINAYANNKRLLLIQKQHLKILRHGIREHTLTRLDIVKGKKETVKIQAELKLSWDNLHTDLMLLGHDITRTGIDSLLRNKRSPAVADTLSVFRVPFSGIIMDTPPIAGQWIQANTPVFRLEDLHRVYVTVAVPDKLLDNWLTGQTQIQAKKGYLELQPVQGTPRIDGTSGLHLLVFTTVNLNNNFGNGQWIHLSHRGPAQPVVWIPESAVVSRNNRSWCIVKKNKKYTPTPIKVGIEKNGKIPVFSGLKMGQQVVYENAYELLYRDLKALVKFVD